MKPVPRLDTDADGSYASSSRIMKAEALAILIRKHFPERDESLANALWFQSAHWWEAVSHAAGVNPPSAATIELVCKSIRIASADPFDFSGTPRDKAVVE